MTKAFRGRRRGLLTASVVAISAVLLAACGGGSGGESGDLVVGASLAMTGPNAAAGAVRFGLQARFDEINEKGGIQGHKLVVKIADDQLDPALAPGTARTLVESDEALAVLPSGSAVAAAMLPYLKAQGVLGVPTNGAIELVEDPESTFRLYVPTYVDLAATMVDYAVNKAGAQKIAIAYTPDAVGNPWLEGAKAELAKLGKTEVAAVSFSAKATSAAAQAAELKASGADFVLINHVPAVANVLISANEQIGYKPKYGSTFALANPSLPKLVGNALDDRIFFATGFIDPDSPDAADYRKYVTAAGGDPYDTNVVNGWTAGDAYVAVLTKAVADAGGKAPTREQVMAATEGLKIDTAYIKGVNWTQTVHTGVTQARITTLNGGKFTEVAPFAQMPGTTP